VVNLKDAAMNNKIKGTLAIVLSCAFFSTASISVKIMAGHYSGPFLSFMRFAFGCIFSIGILFLAGKGFQIKDKRYLLMRGIFGAAAMFSFYSAIQMTSSGRATLLGGTYPVFVAILGFLIFKEQFRTNRIISIAFCIVGIFMIFYDHSKYSFIGNMIGLLSGASSGVAVHYIKKSRARNNPMVIYLSACVFGLLISSFSVTEIVKIQSLRAFLMIMLIAAASFVGQMLMTYGFKYVSATQGSILGYTEILLTIAASFFLGEDFKPRFFIGGAIIIAGLLINQVEDYPVWNKLSRRYK
jgi:drug/metabolite transporter (DMT)-like permease